MMKYTYKKVFKLLLKEYRKTHATLIVEPSILELYRSNPKFFHAVDILHAKELIIKSCDVGGGLQCIEITNKGITYFEDRKKEILHFWLPVTISGLALLVATASLSLDIFELLKQ